MKDIYHQFECLDNAFGIVVQSFDVDGYTVEIEDFEIVLEDQESKVQLCRPLQEKVFDNIPAEDMKLIEKKCIEEYRYQREDLEAEHQAIISDHFQDHMI